MQLNGSLWGISKNIIKTTNKVSGAEGSSLLRFRGVHMKYGTVNELLGGMKSTNQAVDR